MVSDRGRLLPAVMVALPIPIVTYASIQVMTIAPDLIPGAGWSFFWVLVAIWVAALPTLLIKPLNLGALRLAGARRPTQSHWRRLHEPWQQVLVRSVVVKSSETVGAYWLSSGWSTGWLIQAASGNFGARGRRANRCG